MSQDNKPLIGIVIIGLIISGWLMWNNAFKTEPAPKPPVTADSTQHSASTAPPATVPEISDSVRRKDSFGDLFAPHTLGSDRTVMVNTSLYTAVLSTHGGGLQSLVLKHYNTWDGHPVPMVNPGGSQINMLFESSEGRLISTKDLYFTADGQQDVTLHDDSTTFTFTLDLGAGRTIQKVLTFHDNTYVIDARFELNNCVTAISNYHYQVTWDGGLPFVEHNSIDECQGATAAAFMNGAMEEIDADKPDSVFKKMASGQTNWVATRTKYFAAALIAPKAAQGSHLEGKRVMLPNSGAREEYTIALEFPFTKNAHEVAAVSVFVGPLDYSHVHALGVDLEKIMSFGWTYFRPIGIYLLLPLLKTIHLVVPNYGLVLLIFALLIKVLMTPLSIGQMKMSKKSQLLMPLMSEMKEKYKDDPAKMNAETMRLYSTYGVNPAGGCLPMLLQLPLLYVLWAMLRNAIELRQAPFAGWIQDLSAPDVIATLPFRLPLFGIEHVSALALLLGVVMFFQQRMTIQDPRQKAMMMMMPVLMMFMFMSFPSGLNLYYLMFNFLSVAHQMWFNRRHSEITLESMKKEPKAGTPGKMSFTQRLLAAQQEAQKQKGRKR